MSKNAAPQSIQPGIVLPPNEAWPTDQHVWDSIRLTFGEKIADKLSFKRWKDGIDIDYPTHEAMSFARQMFAMGVTSTLENRASLKARAEQAEQEVYLMESNAREQAKLLADTGRRVEELERECRILREVMNTPSEPDVIRLHREKCNALDRVFALEEIARQSRDAMLRTRTASIAGCEEGYGKPEKWGDELFQSHGGLTNAIKAIDDALPRPFGVAREARES